MIKASVILAFYKRIDYLKLVLKGFERQTFHDFEIIIADDGSSPMEVYEVEKLSKSFSFPITHLWHEDKGFRKNKILNRAIVSANSDYLIFVDADCVPHSEFVAEHFNYRNSKTCFTGRRVNLSERITGCLTPQRTAEGFLEKNLVMLIEDGIFGKSFDVEKGFYFRCEILRKFFNKKKRGIVGCNFSIHKEDFLKINGFDERYEAPSIGEDSDVEYRLRLCGVEIKSLNNIAVQYHLYHKLQNRPQKNLNLFEEVKSSGEYFTRYGIIR
ncbi:MAG: glycosyltransferase [Ignavibacteriaceae bacterium]|jgi:glycosyltransferase involved in cell wall biosynthesis